MQQRRTNRKPSSKVLSEEHSQKKKVKKIPDKKKYTNELKELTQTWNDDLCE